MNPAYFVGGIEREGELKILLEKSEKESWKFCWERVRRRAEMNVET